MRTETTVKSENIHVVTRKYICGDGVVIISNQLPTNHCLVYELAAPPRQQVEPAFASVRGEKSFCSDEIH